jgi:NAD(P)-dependent dehydrogenase (short-subunit alcohol dehydrogenase family)
MSSPDSGRPQQAIVVGAGGAFGTAIVAALIEAGQMVIGVGRDAAAMAPLAERHGGGFLPVAADIGSDDAIETIRAVITGAVSMVVHAPGVPVAGGIRTAPTGALVEACNIKVGGFVRLVRAAEPFLHKGSRLVAVGGHYGFEPTAYAATAGVANAAIASVVKQMSWAYGDLGVTAHLIAPGPADTARLRGVAETRARQSGVSVDEVIDDMRGESAIGAFATPDQVAWAIALLLDPRADAMAGSTLMVDVGRRRAVG